MEALDTWVRNIVFYLIFMTFVTNLLPGKAYVRYFRLFTGMVLILLVLSPLTGSLNLDERLAYYFESISFQSEAGEYRGQIEEMERKRLEQLIGQYEAAASEDLERRLSDAGCRGVRAQVRISRDRESSDFGTVETVEVWIEEMKAAPGSESEGFGQEAEPFRVTLVEDESAWNWEDSGRGGQENLDSAQREGKPGESASQVSAPGIAGSREAIKIRKEIAEFYGLEESHIKVQMGKGRDEP